MVFNKESSTPASNVTSKSEEKSKILRLLSDNNIPVTLKFDEISANYNPYESDKIQNAGGQVVESGVSYPVIRINDVVLARINITRMTISSVGMLPTITLGVTFTETDFVNKNMPKDGDLISVYMRTNSNALKWIRNEYIITGCTTNLSKNGDTSATLTGKLFIPGFDSLQNVFGMIGTSKSVFKSVARKYGIGFQYNDSDDTQDYQNWIGCNESMETFLGNVIQHAWKDNSSFFKTWINLYYELAFVNVNKFLLTSDNEEEIDFTALTRTMKMDKSETPENQSTKSTQIIPKVLTNSGEFRGTPMFIREWKPINNSSSVSMSNGYKTQSFSFIHNQNLINSSKDLCFSTLNNIPAYDKNKTDSYMILRGRNHYDASLNPEGEMKRQNYNYVDTYIRKNWCGVEYTMSDDDDTKPSSQWSGNVHKNYSRAVDHNRINNMELGKMFLEVTCDGLCLQIMRGERVPVYLVYEGVTDTELNNSSDTDEKRDVNRTYTGYYIVDSMEFSYNPTNTISPYSTKMKLCRREWPTPEAI